MRTRAASGPPGTIDQYWEWGLPSLYLATLTVLLFVAHTVLQPGVKPRYEGIVRTTASGDLDPLSDNDLRALRMAEIAAQRLVTISPETFQPRWDAAQLTLRLAEFYRARSIAAESKNEGASASQYTQQASDALDRGRTMMKRAASISSDESRQAKLWVLEQDTFQNLRNLPSREDEWESLIQSWKTTWNPEEADGRAAELYGALLLSHALALDSSLSSQDRSDRVNEAIDTFSRMSNRSLQGEVWLAEALSVQNPEKGIEHLRPLRTQLILEAQNASDPNRIGIVDAVFRALMLSVSIDEAGDFATNQLADTQKQERELLRNAIQRSIVRRIVAILVPSNRAQSFGRSDAQDLDSLIRIGLRTGPDLKPIMDLCIQLLSKDPVSNVASEVTERLAQSHDSPVRDALQWFRNALWQEGTPEIGLDAPMRQDPFVAVNLLPSFVSVARANQIPLTRIDNTLAALIAQFPQIADLRLYRAILNLETRDFAIAIALLEDLEQQFPNNEQIQVLRESAKKQADLAPR